MDMSVVLTRMGVLVGMMLVGFVCAKLGVTGPESNKHFSKLQMNVFLVATVIYTSLTAEVKGGTEEVVWIIFLSALVIIICGALGWISARIFRVPDKERNIFAFMVMLMNNMFVAAPVIEVIYGQTGVMYIALSNLPFNICMYTVGVMMIGGRENGKLSFKKIMTPPMIAVIIGIFITIFKIKMPEVITGTLGYISGATIPVALIVVGTSLGEMPIKDTLNDWRMYALSFMRLIIGPIIVWLVLRLFVTDPVVLGSMTIMAAAPVAMVANVLAIEYNNGEKYASKGIFVSTALSAVTMPFIIWLLL